MESGFDADLSWLEPRPFVLSRPQQVVCTNNHEQSLLRQPDPPLTCFARVRSCVGAQPRTKRSGCYMYDTALRTNLRYIDAVRGRCVHRALSQRLPAYDWLQCLTTECPFVMNGMSRMLEKSLNFSRNDRRGRLGQLCWICRQSISLNCRAPSPIVIWRQRGI